MVEEEKVWVYRENSHVYLLLCPLSFGKRTDLTMSTSSFTSVKQMGYRYVVGCFYKLNKPLDNRRFTVVAVLEEKFCRWFEEKFPRGRPLWSVSRKPMACPGSQLCYAFHLSPSQGAGTDLWVHLFPFHCRLKFLISREQTRSEQSHDCVHQGEFLCGKTR